MHMLSSSPQQSQKPRFSCDACGDNALVSHRRFFNVDGGILCEDCLAAQRAARGNWQRVKDLCGQPLGWLMWLHRLVKVWLSKLADRLPGQDEAALRARTAAKERQAAERMVSRLLRHGGEPALVQALVDPNSAGIRPSKLRLFIDSVLRRPKANPQYVADHVQKGAVARLAQTKSTRIVAMLLQAIDDRSSVARTYASRALAGIEPGVWAQIDDRTLARSVAAALGHPDEYVRRNLQSGFSAWCDARIVAQMLEALTQSGLDGEAALRVLADQMRSGGPAVRGPEVVGRVAAAMMDWTKPSALRGLAAKALHGIDWQPPTPDVAADVNPPLFAGEVAVSQAGVNLG